MNQETLRRIAEEWKALPHNPQGASWAPFVREVSKQYLWLIKGLGIDVIPTNSNPYQTSDEMFMDVICRRVLKVWTGGSGLEPGHPLAETHRGVSLNVMFRAVHDYYGHCNEEHPFETIEGELAAYREHRKMFSAEAIPALFGETVGQLAYFSAFGEYVPTQKAVEFGPEFLALVD